MTPVEVVMEFPDSSLLLPSLHTAWPHEPYVAHGSVRWLRVELHEVTRQHDTSSSTAHAAVYTHTFLCLPRLITDVNELSDLFHGGILKLLHRDEVTLHTVSGRPVWPPLTAQAHHHAHALTPEEVNVGHTLRPGRATDFLRHHPREVPRRTDILVLFLLPLLPPCPGPPVRPAAHAEKLESLHLVTAAKEDHHWQQFHHGLLIQCFRI